MRHVGTVQILLSATTELAQNPWLVMLVWYLTVRTADQIVASVRRICERTSMTGHQHVRATLSAEDQGGLLRAECTTPQTAGVCGPTS
jgi:hypothetical protein